MIVTNYLESSAALSKTQHESSPQPKRRPKSNYPKWVGRLHIADEAVAKATGSRFGLLMQLVRIGVETQLDHCRPAKDGSWGGDTRSNKTLAAQLEVPLRRVERELARAKRLGLWRGSWCERKKGPKKFVREWLPESTAELGEESQIYLAPDVLAAFKVELKTNPTWGGSRPNSGGTRTGAGRPKRITKMAVGSSSPVVAEVAVENTNEHEAFRVEPGVSNQQDGGSIKSVKEVKISYQDSQKSLGRAERAISVSVVPEIRPKLDLDSEVIGRPAAEPTQLRHARIRQLAGRYLPKKPDMRRFPAAEVPKPPTLSPDLGDPEATKFLADAYLGAVHDRFKKRGRAPQLRGDVTRSRHYATLLEFRRAVALRERQVSPVAWVLFSIDQYRLSGFSDKPPPLRWVFSVTRLEKSFAWFEECRSRYVTKRVMYSHELRSLCDRWDRMWGELVVGDPRTREAALSIIDRHFPGGEWERLEAVAVRGQRQLQTDIDRMVGEGKAGLWL